MHYLSAYLNSEIDPYISFEGMNIAGYIAALNHIASTASRSKMVVLYYCNEIRGKRWNE